MVSNQNHRTYMYFHALGNTRVQGSRLQLRVIALNLFTSFDLHKGWIRHHYPVI